jgi:DNA relaxase NicK
MANKRTLKKQIHYACGDLAAENIMARHLLPGVNNDAVNLIINDIAELQVNSLARVSFFFDKTKKNFDNEHEYRKARKNYFKKAYNKLAEDFNNNVAEIVKAMNASLSKEAKEANKEAANA